jgi:hypothetical protein
VFTARYALSPYIKQIRFVFKRLIKFTHCDHTDYQAHAPGWWQKTASFLNQHSVMFLSLITAVVVLTYITKSRQRHHKFPNHKSDYVRACINICSCGASAILPTHSWHSVLSDHSKLKNLVHIIKSLSYSYDERQLVRSKTLTLVVVSQGKVKTVKSLWPVNMYFRIYNGLKCSRFLWWWVNAIMRDGTFLCVQPG